MKLRLRLRREIGKREILTSLQEINQEFESQRFQVHQTSGWADQAQRDKISLYGELELRRRFFQKDHARDCPKNEELRRICCEETDRARQARIDELPLHHERNLTTVSQLMTQIRELQNKVNSMSDAGEFYGPESGSSSGATHVPDQASTILSPTTLPRCDFGLPRNTQNCTGIMRNVFERPHVQEGLSSTIFHSTKDSASSSQVLRRPIKQGKGRVEWKENCWIHRFNHLTSEAEVECYSIHRELILTMVWLIIQELLLENWILEIFRTPWNFKAGKSTSELRFV